MDQQDQIQNSLYKSWRDEENNSKFHLDVRDLLEAGEEPYSIIMKTILGIKKNEALVLHVPFKPNPLISQLHRMGYSTNIKHDGVDHFSLTIKMTGVE